MLFYLKNLDRCVNHGFTQFLGADCVGWRYRQFEKDHGLVALSANRGLPDRMMGVAASFTPRQEVYPIDESVLEFSGVPGDWVTVCRGVRASGPGADGPGD